MDELEHDTRRNKTPTGHKLEPVKHTISETNMLNNVEIEVIKEEKYEESYTQGKSKVSPLDPMKI